MLKVDFLWSKPCPVD